MVEEAKWVASESNTGKVSTEAMILMYERTILPAVLYNLEVWTKWRKSDWEELERIQATTLKSMLHLPKTTPYWGILNELGMWTMKARLIYKK